ncbi:MULTISPECIES: maleylacetate reductase [Bradyrhizobium]|jgi:alcohol dehydrogenase class IV|uniref:Maleylacetate reductase n=2 Tax=Nitrobacteraceae TaxID=41294 RepID=A0A5P6PI03_9BRAD|nr:MULTISPECIES: maleylacetate reductase [Bradyrhizobium]MBX3494289.1 maleylacetate reductase [Parvibaculum sp.]MCW5702831.1 maleylacetate reductase [Bradyrhizobium sp.]OYU86521.1 MAG: maleylacetate reductase [Bradyrhizobiaceae bacterium PARB1]HEV7326623.1 maleylacetate reductase [Bosea sp. (in: a-proteobacteria)]AUD00264.1 maleylacetate reductase [Bradyrhizobium sp. SK17]
MLQSFTFDSAIPRVVFGVVGLDVLAAETASLGVCAPLLVTTRRGAAKWTSFPDSSPFAIAGLYDGAEVHTPVNVTEDALRYARSVRADGFVSFGGGSSIGLGKALSLRTGLPHLAIPTTYSGSEMTSILGETSQGKKQTHRNRAILPATVLYDVSNTRDLPTPVSVMSGLNAIAHAVEAMYAQNGSPLISDIAERAISAMARAIPNIVETPSDLVARQDALYGAWLAGICLNAAGMGLHHKLCHELGGAFDLPHAELHAILLPHTLAYNQIAMAEAYGRLQAALGDPSPQHRLFEFARVDGIPRSLATLKMPREGIDSTVARVLSNPYWNPRPLEAAPLRDLIERAWNGAVPDSPM